jgi:CYTH domain-containing protein
MWLSCVIMVADRKVGHPQPRRANSPDAERPNIHITQQRSIMSTSRRFLIAASLARLIQREKGGARLIEGYFPQQDERSSHVQVVENRSFLVLRISGPTGSVEERVEVPQSHADALLDVVTGVVDYVRSTLAIGAQEIHVDQFLAPGSLQVISVEFEHDPQAREFSPLP